MEVLVERCAGLDVGKADLKACVRVPGPRGGRRQQIKTFATTTGSLLRLRDWLIEQQVTVVGMEATGDYWKPVYYVLEDAVEVQLLKRRAHAQRAGPQERRVRFAVDRAVGGARAGPGELRAAATDPPLA